MDSRVDSMVLPRGYHMVHHGLPCCFHGSFMNAHGSFVDSRSVFKDSRGALMDPNQWCFHVVPHGAIIDSHGTSIVLSCTSSMVFP